MKCPKCKSKMNWTYDFEEMVCAPFKDDESGYYFCPKCKKIIYKKYRD